MPRALPENGCRHAAAAGSRLPSGARRRGGHFPLLLAAGLGLLALLPVPAARAIPGEGLPPKRPAAPAQQPAAPAPAAQPATTAPPAVVAPPPAPPSIADAARATAAKTPPKKVWTQADLEALRAMPGANIILVDPTGQDAEGWYMPDVTTRRADPSVLARLEALKGEANKRVEALERERLAAANPLLRGMNRDAEGKPAAPRSVADIDADIARWNGRRAAADDTIRRTLDAAGQNPDNYQPQQ